MTPVNSSISVNHDLLRGNLQNSKIDFHNKLKQSENLRSNCNFWWRYNVIWFWLKSNHFASLPVNRDNFLSIFTFPHRVCLLVKFQDYLSSGKCWVKRVNSFQTLQIDTFYPNTYSTRKSRGSTKIKTYRLAKARKKCLVLPSVCFKLFFTR